MNIVIVTSCPSGIANSVIAAGLLEKAAASWVGMPLLSVTTIWNQQNY